MTVSFQRLEEGIAVDVILVAENAEEDINVVYAERHSRQRIEAHAVDDVAHETCAGIGPVSVEEAASRRGRLAVREGVGGGVEDPEPVVPEVGGFGNIKGTIFSAFILALVESFAVAYLSLQYKDVFAFVVMIIILLFKR